MSAEGALGLPKPKRDRILHWARHAEVADWVALGWIIVRPNARMAHHDHYSVTVEWLCDCATVRPARHG
jgi:hypothetical protein